MITRFPHASFAILDSFFRAIANTGHAMRTICPPDRFILIQTDVIQWAQLHAFSAADTGITYRKSICLDDFLVENGIYRTTHKAVIQIISRCGKFHPIADTVNDASDSGLFTIFPFGAFFHEVNPMWSFVWSARCTMTSAAVLP